MDSSNPIIPGSGSVLGIAEDLAEIWPQLWGKHKWAFKSLESSAANPPFLLLWSH